MGFFMRLLGLEPLQGTEADREVTEADRVKQEVEKQKKIAKDKGVEEIAKLYFDELEYYPSWIKQNGGRSVPKVISEAKGVKIDNKRITTIILSNKTYRFEFSYRNHESDWDDSNYGLLELFSDDKKVLGFDVELKARAHANWEVRDISAFIDGEWFADFCNLIEAVNDKRRRQDEAKEQERQQELKRNFGLE